MVSAALPANPCIIPMSNGRAPSLGTCICLSPPRASLRSELTPSARSMTTHYRAAEIGNLLAAVNRLASSREFHAGTVLRVVG